MNDKYGIDSHKLMYHPKRIVDWLDGEHVAPIYVEISPTSACNHRCVFCCVDYVGYKPEFLDLNRLKKSLVSMYDYGVKSVMYGGEGEPLLHKDLADLIVYSKVCGLDVALTTNGVLLNEKFCSKALGSLSWIKVSIDAGSSKTYDNIHRGKHGDFEKVLENLELAVYIKNKFNLNTTIGTQLLLLPDNYIEVPMLVDILGNIGVDYLVIKPYSQHLYSNTKLYENLNYTDEELNSLVELGNNSIDVIVRVDTMEAIVEEKQYNNCRSCSFWSYIDSCGDVYACSAYLKNENFVCGNIYNNRFNEVWDSKKTRQVLNMIENMDIGKCRKACRMDKINRYLHALVNQSEHINFI